MGSSDSKATRGTAAGSGPSGGQGRRTTFEWKDSGNRSHQGNASTLPGWRWGMLLTGVPHPQDWPESLWNVLERLIVSNGLLTLEDSVVCTPDSEERMVAAGVPLKVDLGAIVVTATGGSDNEAYLDALNATLERLVAMEQLFLSQPSPDMEALDGAHGISRSLTVRQARMFARSEHDHM